MQINLLIASCSALVLVGCTFRETDAEKSRDREAKVRAEAGRMEMEALPKAFQTPDYFKKNEPEKKAFVAPDQIQPKR